MYKTHKNSGITITGKLFGAFEPLSKIALIALLGFSAAACSNSAGQMGTAQLVSADSVILDPFAASAIQARDWDRAVAQLEGKCAEDPLKMINLAFAYHQKGRSDEAIEIYENIIAGDQNPYAERPGAVQLRVKTIAKRALAKLTS